MYAMITPKTKFSTIKALIENGFELYTLDHQMMVWIEVEFSYPVTLGEPK